VSQGHKTLTTLLHDALTQSGTWLSREQLQVGRGSSEVAMDDALSDLVIEGRAEYRENVGYRLSGGRLARAALRQLVRAEPGINAVVRAQEKDGEMRMGVAENRAELGRVMYELVLPAAAAGVDPLDHLQRQIDGVTAFIGAKGGQLGRGV
jgi:hypothetical protein